MSYNENEIVKLKHLNEFARQLNVKLEGGADPKIDRPAILRYSQPGGGNAPKIAFTAGISFSVIVLLKEAYHGNFH